MIPPRIQFNLSDFTRRAYGTNYIETLRVQLHANCRISSGMFVMNRLLQSGCAKCWLTCVARHSPHLLQRPPVQRGRAASRIQAFPSRSPAADYQFFLTVASQKGA